MFKAVDVFHGVQDARAVPFMDMERSIDVPRLFHLLLCDGVCATMLMSLEIPRRGVEAGVLARSKQA